MNIKTLLLLSLLLITEVYKAQTFNEEEQAQIDSLNQLINTPTSHDTTLASAYLGLSEILYVSNVDTLKVLCEKVQAIAEKGLSDKTTIPIKKSLKKSLAGALNNIGYVYDNSGDISNALKYYNKSLKINKEIGNKKGIASSFNNIGTIYKHQGDLPNALKYYHKSLAIREEIGDKKGVAIPFNNIGYVYNQQGDIPNALRYYHKSLKIKEENGDKGGVARSLTNIGNIYQNQGDLTNALKYYNKSLKIQEGIGDKFGIAGSFNNIGYIYSNQGETSKALEYFRKSLKIEEEIGYKVGIASTFTNIGWVFQAQDDLSNALIYYNKSLKIEEEIGNKEGVTTSLLNIGNIYFETGKAIEAKKHAFRSFSLSQELGFPSLVEKSAGLLSKIAINQGNYKEAFEMRNLEIEMRDSLASEEAYKATAQQQAKYEYEKKAATDSIQNAEAQKVTDAELAAHKAENKQHTVEAARQKEQKYYLYGGLFIALLFGGFIFNRLKVTRKQKSTIEEQKQEVENTHKQLSEHHKEIQDSINYAKRIQEAIMPSMEAMNDALGNGFILYQPKDIVAGDFFWMETVSNVIEGSRNVVYFAAADCTGHGVPGAMVSVVCSNALNKALLEEGITDVGKLLDRTREIVIERLAKSGEEVKDGMDVSLCALNMQTNELQWSGANNPLWILRNGATEFEETKADKQPIGMYANPKPFTTHTIQLNNGDGIYIFTDGYQDQFGGPKGKKFKAKPLKQLIIDNQTKSMEEQKESLQFAFNSWQGEQEQVDDVCVIGVKV